MQVDSVPKHPEVVDLTMEVDEEDLCPSGSEEEYVEYDPRSPEYVDIGPELTTKPLSALEVDDICRKLLEDSPVVDDDEFERRMLLKYGSSSPREPATKEPKPEPTNDEGVGAWHNMIPNNDFDWGEYERHVCRMMTQEPPKKEDRVTDFRPPSPSDDMMVHFKVVACDPKGYPFVGAPRLYSLFPNVEMDRLFPLVERDFPVGDVYTLRMGGRQVRAVDTPAGLGAVVGRCYEVKLLLLHLPCREQTWFRKVEPKSASADEASATMESAGLTSLAEIASASPPVDKAEASKKVSVQLWWGDRLHATVFWRRNRKFKLLLAALMAVHRLGHMHLILRTTAHELTNKGSVGCLDTLLSLSMPLGGTLRMSYTMNLPDTSPHFLPYPIDAWKILKQAGYQGKTSPKRETGIGIGVNCVKSIGCSDMCNPKWNIPLHKIHISNISKNKNIHSRNKRKRYIPRRRPVPGIRNHRIMKRYQGRSHNHPDHIGVKHRYTLSILQHNRFSSRYNKNIHNKKKRFRRIHKKNVSRNRSVCHKGDEHKRKSGFRKFSRTHPGNRHGKAYSKHKIISNRKILKKIPRKNPNTRDHRLPKQKRRRLNTYKHYSETPTSLRSIKARNDIFPHQYISPEGSLGESYNSTSDDQMGTVG